MSTVTQRDYNTVNKEAGYNISWRAIIAGVVTFIALFLVFSLIGNAIGFGFSDLTSNDPLHGVGTGLLVWLVIAIVASLAGGGYVAGITANRAGFVHGFLTWATSVIALFFVLGQLVSGAIGIAGNVIGSTGNAVANIAQEAGANIADLSQDAFNQIAQNVSINTDELQETVEGSLRSTDIPQLQPEYLQKQVNDSLEDIKNAGYAIVVNGQDPQAVIKSTSDKIQARVDNVGKNLDHDALVKAVSQNTTLTPAEVDASVKNIEDAYNKAAKEADMLMNQASAKLNELTVQAQEGIQHGREVAEDVTNQIAKVSTYAFIGLVIGLFITAYAGHYGSKQTSPFEA